MTTALATQTIPVQPRETFTCPAWCVLEHDRESLDRWEYGQWTVRHEGDLLYWSTSRGTEMRARLIWTEIVGSSPIIIEDFLDLTGPSIELDGDDGSGYMGTHEIVGLDWPEWQRVLTKLWKQVSA
ncbi:hypothetical protein ASF37_11645 [Aeromicrobium sp. Leaf289]|uniref:hypothetical protein n=1 Tax=Aeromicrobium sp. Leaf289 TaxID=1736324 RepID=UPI0006F5F3EF|nr:hypothetical protein [Aeromicrobium sp. Leaf289]KQP77210.1 hypothetical protein ASF37_11645 [Aeromicrobium sp. Leaf289]